MARHAVHFNAVACVTHICESNGRSWNFVSLIDANLKLISTRRRAQVAPHADKVSAFRTNSAGQDHSKTFIHSVESIEVTT